MDERFPDEFVTWNHLTPIGVKVSEVFGMDSKSGKVWCELARQIYSEQGQPNYRVIEHFQNGAPFLEGYNGRISLTHTSNFFAVASLPKTPEINLEFFNPRAAMGIDAEPIDRQQVLKVRNKFLSEKERLFISSDNLLDNIIAWTSKEALYKSALTPGIDYVNNIVIEKLPKVSINPEKNGIIDTGSARIIFPADSEWSEQEMVLYSYLSYDCCVTIALSPKCAKYGKSNTGRQH